MKGGQKVEQLEFEKAYKSLLTRFWKRASQNPSMCLQKKRKTISSM